MNMSVYSSNSLLLTGDRLTDEQKQRLISFRRALRNGQWVNVRWCLCFDIATPPSLPAMQYINGTGWPVVSGNVKVFGGGEINTENNNSSRRFSFYYCEKYPSSGFAGNLIIGNSLSVIMKYPQRTEFTYQQLSESVSIDSKSLGISIRVSSTTRKEGQVLIYRSLPPSSLSLNEGWKWKVLYQPHGCNVVVVAWEYEKKNLSHFCLFLFSERDWLKFWGDRKPASTESDWSPVCKA